MTEILIENIFMPNNSITMIKENNMININKMSIKELKDVFINLFVIYLKSDECINKFDKSNIVIQKVPFKILESQILKHHLTLIDTIYLPIYYIEINGTKTNITTDIILTIPLINLKGEVVQNYLTTYAGISNILTIYNKIISTDYLQDKINDKIFCNMINTMYESEYWCNNDNCKIDHTKKFIDRVFNITYVGTTDKEKEEIYNSIKSQNAYDFILNEINPVLYDKGDINFKIPYNNCMMEVDFNKMFNICCKNYSDKSIYLLMSNMLLAKDICHLVVNNNYTLTTFFTATNNDKSHIFRKNIYTYATLWSYAWFSLLQFECNKCTNIIETDNFVFKIDIANKLPIFPSINIYTSNYLPLPINQDVYKHSIIPFKKYKNCKYGVCDKNTFIKRMDLFIGIKNLFDNMDWSKYAITGSIMAACLPSFNPLIPRCDNLYNYDKDCCDMCFTDFIDKYYNNADIDIMCNSETYIEFIDDIERLVQLLDNNIKKNINNDSNIEVIVNKKCVIFVNELFIEKYVLPNTTYDLPYIKTHINDVNVIKLFYKWYINEKIKDIEIHKQTNKFCQKYVSYFEPCGYNEMTITIYKNLNKNITQIPYCTIKESLKYKLISKYLKRPIEVFKTKNNNFFNTVARFHLPCVRAYYRNNEIYILPSCISACMELINIDYKYFAAIKNPFEILYKYINRGFGIILNHWESSKYNEYLKNNNITNKINHNNLKLEEYHANNIAKEYEKIYNINITDVSMYPKNCVKKSGLIYTFKKWKLEEYYEKQFMNKNNEIITNNNKKKTMIYPINIIEPHNILDAEDIVTTINMDETDSETDNINVIENNDVLELEE